MEQDFAQLRQKMVNEQIIARNITDKAVLGAMGLVPRHYFVSTHLQSASYQDSPLPIGEGQTISQPYIVALMASAAHIDGTSKVLEIGTGSGYAAAVLSRIAKEVYTVERIASLSQSAEKVFHLLNYTNIFLTVGDGTLGWADFAPYDAIIVTAGAPMIPPAYYAQLKIGGRIVIPVGDALCQQLLLIHKIDVNNFKQETVELVRFVPLIGQQGWDV